jgi:voltage-gated potassium channel Kch
MRLVPPLVVGWLMIGALVVVQAIAVTAIVRLLRREAQRGDRSGGWFHGVGVFSRALLLIVIAQLIEIAAWAAIFLAIGEFRDFPTAFYHSAMNFTTLGYGDIVMSPRWRLLGPLEAVAGMLMFGLSTAVLFAVVQALVRRREGRALEDGFHHADR